MKILVTKLGSTLRAFGDNDREQINTLESGKTYEVEIRLGRNLAFHRKYFKMLKTVYENQEQFETLEDLRTYVIMKAGYIHRIPTPKGEILLPKSISFAKMDEAEFKELYEDSGEVLARLIGVSYPDLMNELNEFLD